MREVHGWRRVRRWIGGAALGLVGLVAIALVVAGTILYTRWGREFVRARVEHALEQSFVGGAHVGAIEGSPFGDIVIRDLEIRGPDHVRAIGIATLRVHVRLLPLLLHEVSVTKLIADDVAVELRRDGDGELQAKHLTKPGPPSTWSVRLARVEVHRAHVAFDTGSPKLGTIDLDDLQLDATARLPHGGPVDVAATLSARWRQRDAPIDLAAVLHNDAGVLAVPAALVRIADVELSVAGARATKRDSALDGIAGVVALRAPAATLASLVPGVHVPADIALAIDAAPRDGTTAVAIAGALGTSALRGFALGDLRARAARGCIVASHVELGTWSRGAIDGVAGALAAFEVEPGERGALPAARALVLTWLHDGPAGDGAALLALDSRDGTPRAGFAATGAGVRAGLAASGVLSPHPDLAVRGFVSGTKLRVRDVHVGALAMRIDAAHLPARPSGTVRVEVDALSRGAQLVDHVVVAAGGRKGGKIQASIRAEQSREARLVELDAAITPGATTRVDLLHHLVRLAPGEAWHGRRGYIAIGPERVEVRDLRSESPAGHVALDASYVRGGPAAGDLDAKLDAAVELAALGTPARGRVDSRVDVARHGARWRGTADVVARGVTVRGLAVDADVKLAGSPGRVQANVEARTARAGRARLGLDLAAPVELENARAWRALRRDAIRSFDVALDGIDLAALAKAAGSRPLSGRVDGALRMTARDTHGDIRVRNVSDGRLRELGAIGVDLAFEQPARDELRATATAKVQALGTVALDARVEAPDRLFDPAAWRRRGLAALRSARLHSDELAFEPGALARLGIATSLRGKAAFTVDVAPAVERATVEVDVRELRGGTIALPVEARLSATMDRRKTSAELVVRGNKLELLRAHGELGLALAELRADPRAARSAPVFASLEIPRANARSMLAVVGASQIVDGTLGGTIDVRGSLAKLTATAAIVARDVSMPPGPRGALPTVRQLSIDAAWDGTTATLAIGADETSGGKLRLTARGSPKAPADVVAQLDAEHVDLEPLVGAVPGPAGGIAGKLDANLTLRGLDPRTAQLSGKLHIANARVPVAPAIGTLYKSDIAIEIAERKLAVRAKGKLGRGSIEANGSVQLVGDTPSGGKLEVALHGVQLIGTTEPRIDGVITAQVARNDGAWRVDVDVTRSNVVIPDEKGTKLAPVGAPNDVVYGVRRRRATQTRTAGPRPPPEHPFIVTTIKLAATHVESKEVRGTASGRVQISVGDTGIAITGDATLDSGDLDLFGRRYDIERAAVHFDGPPDPLLDVRITHDFPEVTTITEIHGRMSKPELVMSSDPGIYSQAELLGFLLGGEPGGDPNNAPSASSRVATAAEGFVANQIGGYVRKVLPIDLDVLRYESATSTTSAAVVVGTWLTHSLFLLYRQHLEARPDENAGEGEIEFWLQRRLVLETTLGDRGYDGIDLLWRRRW